MNEGHGPCDIRKMDDEICNAADHLTPYSSASEAIVNGFSAARTGKPALLWRYTPPILFESGGQAVRDDAQMHHRPEVQAVTAVRQQLLRLC
ncbi:MAG: hypothetical protein Q4A28_08025 [Brachymonas sp.]|nr:hypothetical protein [Brachymonas sp.]